MVDEVAQRNPSPFGCFAPPFGSRKTDRYALGRSSPLPMGEGRKKGGWMDPAPFGSTLCVVQS
ncbi:DNA-directed RNA polymerase I largest subunit [Brevundimonas sp. G8]|nr:DNA-directed RNA polymerase I largest subunit [Brevundimonas sp. G8]